MRGRGARPRVADRGRSRDGAGRRRPRRRAGDRRAHRAAAAGARAARAPRLRLSLVVDRGRRRGVSRRRPDAVAAERAQSAARDRGDAAAPLRRARARPGVRRAGRGTRGHARLGSAAARDRRDLRRTPGRLLLLRVRDPRIAAALRRRPRRARGGRPQGRRGRGAADGRRRPALSRRVLSSAPRSRGMAARVLDLDRLRAFARRAGARCGRPAVDRRGHAAAPSGAHPDLAGRRRARPALPPRHRSRGQPRDRSLDHRPAVHRRAPHALGAVRGARHRRRARPRRARRRSGDRAPQRGACRALRVRAPARAPRRRLLPRRRARGGPAHDGLHHPHAGRGR